MCKHNSYFETEGVQINLVSITDDLFFVNNHTISN